MPLYRVEIIADVYVWSDSQNSFSVPDEVDKEHLHDILQDLNKYDFGIEAYKVDKLEEVPTEFRSTLVCGKEDTEVKDLFK